MNINMHKNSLENSNDELNSNGKNKEKVKKISQNIMNNNNYMKISLD